MNFTKENLKRLVTELKSLTKEESDQKFIEYFGKEKFEEEEMLRNIYPYLNMLSEEMELDPIPVTYEEILDDSRFCIKDEYIEISNIFRNNFLESLKCLIHEFRHYYQVNLLKTKSNFTYIEKEWMKEFKNPVVMSEERTDEEVTRYCFQFNEIDSYGYTQVIIKKYLNIDLVHPSSNYQTVISKYIEKYLK